MGSGSRRTCSSSTNRPSSEGWWRGTGQGGTVDLNAYDRVIDATGVSRAYLPPIKGDLIADTVQYRVRSEEPLGLWFNTSSIGYEWCFPLGNDEYHVGFGNLRSEVKNYRPPAGKEGSHPLKFSLQMPQYREAHYAVLFAPFTSNGKVVGIGESIGAVAPIVADGNLYAMQTAEMLLENWDDLEGYSEKVLTRYGWMTKERSALEKIMAGRMPTLSEALTMKRHSNMVGVEMKTMHVLKLFRKMSRLGRDVPNSPNELQGSFTSTDSDAGGPKRGRGITERNGCQ